MAVNINYTRPWMPEYQTDILDCKERFTVVEASTKTGKTASHIVWLFEQSLHGREGHEYWWVAPIYRQAEIAFKRMKRQISDKNLYKSNASKLIITLVTGTEIHFKSADNPDSLYGENVRAAVFDEFTRAKESSWHALRSTLTVTKGKCKFIGNYTGSSNWGHKLGKKALTDPQYKYFKITAFDAVKAGILEQEEVEQARKDLPEVVFKALYLAEGSIDDDILFSDDHLESWYHNKHVKPTGKRYLTCDIALHGSDRFVIVVWDGWVIIDIIPMTKTEPDEVERQIKLQAEKHHIPRHRITYDADGVGAYLRGYLRGAKPFNNGSKAVPERGQKQANYLNLKSQCFYKFSKRLADGETLNKATLYKEKINAEFEQIKKFNTDKDGKLRVTPKEMVKQMLGYSPDFAEAIMMREIFELDGRSLPGML